MVNKVMLIGRLGQDPELRYAQSGLPIANFNIATDESYTDSEGNRVEKAEWHRIVVFQRSAEACNNYLKKGSLVYIEGSLQTRKWQAQDGTDRWTTEVKAQRVQFLDSKKDGQSQQEKSQGQNSQQQNENAGPSFPSEANGMDDVPFS